MTRQPEIEPTITDVLGKIYKISEKVNDLLEEVSELSGEVKKLNDKFNNYITTE